MITSVHRSLTWNFVSGAIRGISSAGVATAFVVLTLDKLLGPLPGALFAVLLTLGFGGPIILHLRMEVRLEEDTLIVRNPYRKYVLAVSSVRAVAARQSFADRAVAQLTLADGSTVTAFGAPYDTLAEMLVGTAARGGDI